MKQVHMNTYQTTIRYTNIPCYAFEGGIIEMDEPLRDTRESRLEEAVEREDITNPKSL